ncbi:MAG: xanthine dehydrogenase small subunit [Burkholderiaceae bacterium]
MSAALPAELAIHPLRFVRRGQVVCLNNVAPSRTLLQLLREDLAATGTKEGCGEGDCGACTVVLAEAEGGELRFRAVNSCIRLAHSVAGMALWTVEDITAADGGLHPVQQALLECHASQCGFCTPGFVMSLFALYQQQAGAPVSREMAQETLSGNLCRCTGYRPILDAAQQLGTHPPQRLDTADILQKLEQLRQETPWLEADSAYFLPQTLPDLLTQRAASPQAQLVAGCTDVGLWITKGHQEYAHIIDVTQVAALRRIDSDAQQLVIGAAVPLHDAFAALVAQWPQLAAFAARFAGLPVRNSGTLGGNVANGSPIGDSMPLLIALQAQVVLASVRGSRTLPLERLYTGYRTNVMAADEVLTHIRIPQPPAAGPTPFFQAYKISKRFDDDISAVCLAVYLEVNAGRITRASLGVGGVAATPVRALQTEAALQGRPWTLASLEQASEVLRAEFSPLSDHRASAAYRRSMLGNLLMRFWLECEDRSAMPLAALTGDEAA